MRSLAVNLASLDNNIGSILAVTSGHLSIHHSGEIWSQDLPNPTLSPPLILSGSAQAFGKGPIRQLTIECS